LPYRTTHGPRTIQQLVDVPGPVPYVRDADTYLALGDVAAHAGVLLVDASGLHEADLLGLADDVEEGHFRDVTAREVVGLARPRPLPEHVAAPLVAKAERALRDERVAVIVAGFEPADRPVLWWPPVAGPAAQPHGDARGTLVLNAANPTVEGLLAAPARADLRGPLRALYVTALLLGRLRPSPEQVALLRTAVLDMIDATRLGSVSPEPDRVERRLRSL
jgi:molecular chaperone HtpG